MFTPYYNTQPFHHKDQNELFKVIRLGKYSFDSKYWSEISEEATELITRLLDVDPTTRYSASEALESDWIKDMEDEELARHSLTNSLTSISKTANARKSLVRSVQWKSCKGGTNFTDRISELTCDVVDVSALSVDV